MLLFQDKDVSVVVPRKGSVMDKRNYYEIAPAIALSSRELAMAHFHLDCAALAPPCANTTANSLTPADRSPSPGGEGRGEKAPDGLRALLP